MKFLYRFGFETPPQRAQNEANGWDDEDSGAVVIEAESAEAALRWGRVVAETFMKWLYGDPSVSWVTGEYADYIEPEPTQSPASDEVLTAVTVRVGEMPDLAKVSARSAPYG